MSDLARLLQQYGYGDRPSPLAEDGVVYDTSNVLAGMPKPNPLADALRIAMNGIPENKEHSVSMLNMVRNGLDTAANWLEGRPEVGKDTLAPLGIGFMGGAMPRAARASVATRPKPSWGVWEDAYHGTTNPSVFNRFAPGPEGASFHAADPKLASKFTYGHRFLDEGSDLESVYVPVGSIYPTKINTDGFEVVDWPKMRGGANSYDPGFMTSLIGDAKSRGIPGLVIDNMRDEFLDLPASRQFAVIDPSRIRSRYARFNPDASGSDEILAGTAIGFPSAGNGDRE